MKSPLHLKDYDYALPEELIAQEPPAVRGTSRLMVLDRARGSVAHSSFPELVSSLLRPGDLLVLNDSRVIPARVFAIKQATGARLELLFLDENDDGGWRCLVRPAKRVGPGTRIVFAEGARATAVIGEDLGDGEFSLSFLSTPDGGVRGLLEKSGFMPLPPYIKRDYKNPDNNTRLSDNERYQTVFSAVPGSSAAPTAGLHFTAPLLEQARAKGVETAFVTLHVGLGTFMPLRDENLKEGRLHAERYEIAKAASEAVTRAKQEGRRVVAVGTTVSRVLESVWAMNDKIVPGAGTTDIFIRPPYKFRAVDAMVTNFHIPKSSLLMLVSAFAGREPVLNAYSQAVKAGYRFFSYGDAMFIA